MMDQLPSLERLSERQKDALIQALWAEVQALKAKVAGLEAKVAELEAKLQGPKKGSHNSSVPPSRTPRPASQPPVLARAGVKPASDVPGEADPYILTRTS